jgi:hypothetical protein
VTTFRGSLAAAGSGYDRGLADVAQLVEHQLPKLRVAGSIPVVRFTKSLLRRLAAYRPDAVEIILLRIC